MPVRKCSNGKWRIGNGPCVYTSKSKADVAFRAFQVSKRAHKETKRK